MTGPTAAERGLWAPPGQDGPGFSSSVTVPLGFEVRVDDTEAALDIVVTRKGGQRMTACVFERGRDGGRWQTDAELVDAVQARLVRFLGEGMFPEA